MAATKDQAACRDHAVDALLARKPRILFDPIKRAFRSAAKHREHCAVLQEIDGIIAPLAIRHHAPIQIQNTIEFESIERYPTWQRTRTYIARRRASLAWISFLRYQTHRAPPSLGSTCRVYFRAMQPRHDRAKRTPLQGAKALEPRTG